MRVKSGNGYSSLYAKVKRRDANIVKLKETIESFKRYVRKIGSRSSQRKILLKQAREKQHAAENINKNLLIFLRTPFEKRAYNVMDYFIRVYKSIKSQHELSYNELYLLIYLYNVEFSSSKNAGEYLSLDSRTINSLVFDLSNKDMLTSNRVGKFNYMYITELGRRAVKTLLDIINKQQGIPYEPIKT